MRVKELRICPQCQTPYDYSPQYRAKRCAQCVGALGGAGMQARTASGMPRTYDPELAVFEQLAETLDSLNRAARGRALTWLLARYGDAL